MMTRSAEIGIALIHFTRPILPSIVLLLASSGIPGTHSARAAGIIFSDDFNGTSLNPAWQVLPGQGTYSVAGGQLRYNNNGPQASTTGWYSPALTLTLPFSGTNWEIDTKATYNLNWLDSSGNSSGAQGPEVLVKFNPSVVTSGYGGPNYAGSDYAVIERDIDAYYGANFLAASYGAVTNSDFLSPADKTIRNNIADGTYWYQIIRNGGALTINYSTNGINYATALSTTLSDPSSSYNELLLGGITWATVGSFTNYDYVTINSLDASAVPEPGSVVLLSAGVAAVALMRFRRRRVAVS